MRIKSSPFFRRVKPLWLTFVLIFSDYMVNKIRVTTGGNNYNRLVLSWSPDHERHLTYRSQFDNRDSNTTTGNILLVKLQRPTVKILARSYREAPH